MSRPSQFSPLYAVVPETGGMFMITCDEGWRQSVIATGMRGPVAEWLLGMIQGQQLPHDPARDQQDEDLLDNWTVHPGPGD